MDNNEDLAFARSGSILLSESNEELTRKTIFLYTGDIDLPLEQTLKVLKVAKKYAVQGLVDKCLNRLKSNMATDSVCCLVEIALTNDDDELKNRCLNFIMKDPHEVLSKDSIAELSSDTLSIILKDDNLSMKEEAIFYAVNRYAMLTCQAKGIAHTNENKQAVLGEARKHIRYPLMSKEFFSDVVQESGLLTDNECVKVFKYFINPENGCELFTATPRRMQWRVSRFEEVAKGWGYKRDKQDAITFECSDDVVIEGVELYGASDETANYEVKLMLMQLPFYGLVQRKHAIVETNSTDQTYKLMFDQPALIQRNKDYALCLVCRGPPSYYGVRGMSEIEDNCVIFKFRPNERSTNNTTVDRGQIASIFYTTISRQPTNN